MVVIPEIVLRPVNGQGVIVKAKRFFQEVLLVIRRRVHAGTSEKDIKALSATVESIPAQLDEKLKGISATLDAGLGGIASSVKGSLEGVSANVETALAHVASDVKTGLDGVAQATENAMKRKHTVRSTESQITYDDMHFPSASLG